MPLPDAVAALRALGQPPDAAASAPAARRAAYLAELMLHLAREEDDHAMVVRVTGELLRIAEAEVVAFATGDVDSGMRAVAVVGDVPPALAPWFRGVARREEGGVLWAALERGEPLFAEAYPEAPNALPHLVAAGLTAVAHVPLSIDGSRKGLLSAFRFGRAAWEGETRAVLLASASALQVNLRRARRMGELEETVAYARGLAAVARLNDEETPPVEVARRALAACAEVAGIDTASLAVLDGDELRPHAIWGDHAPFRARRSLRRGAGLAWRALDRGTPVWSDDYAAEPDGLPEVALTGVRAVAWLPLARGTMILVASRLHRVRPWTALDKELLGAVARAVQVALDREERTRLLHEAVLTDPETSLRTRRALDGDLAADLAAARRTALPASLLVVRTPAGEPIEDGLPRRAGEALRRAFRQADRVYRDGDGFAVLLRHTGRDAARVIEQRVRGAAERVGVELHAGMATFPDEAEDAEALLALAEARAADALWGRRR